MEVFMLSESANTPEVFMDPDTGVMRVRGRAIPEDAEKFWSPVLKWFYAYAAIPANQTVFTFQLEYINIASAKRVLFLLNKLSEMNESGASVEVQWLFSSDDADIYEVGKDLSTMVEIPFHFKEINQVYSQAM